MNTLNRRFLFYLPPLLAFLYLLVQSGVVDTTLSLTHSQSVALAVLVLAAVLWVTEWVPLYVTSFVVLFLQLYWLVPAIDPSAGKAARAAYLSPFFSEIILLFLGGFVLAAALHKYAIDSRLAHWLLQRTGTEPGRAMAGFMIASAMLSMWMSNTATTAMMFAILLPIVQKIPAGNPFAKALAISIPFACNLGGLGTPIGTPPNAIAMTYLTKKGYHIGFAQWMGATFPFMLLLLFLLWFMLLKIYPPGKGYQLELPEATTGPWTRLQKTVLGLFLLTIVGWLTTDLHGMSIGVVSLIPVVVAFGSGMLKVQDFKSLPWDVLFMVGGGICLGVGLEKSGLTGHIVDLIPGPDQFWIVLIAFALLAAFMTTFMSNTATANLLIPLAISLDYGVGLVVLTIAINCSTAMALPISTPPNAIAFGSGMLESKDMVRPGVLITLLSLVLVLALGSLYWPLFNI
ncbi:MAG: SLC13 family permease [bacterium]|nr:SLC13 family permease [bacterium]